MKFLLLTIMSIFSFLSSGSEIDKLVKKLDEGKMERWEFPYDVFEVVAQRQKEETWPDVSHLRIPEQNLILIMNFEGQINNGGFDQYYFNSYGDNAKITVRALEAIGAVKSKELLESSFTVFPEGTPSQDRSIRQEQLEALSEKQNEHLSKLDDSFYDDGDIDPESIIEYIKNNLDQLR